MYSTVRDYRVFVEKGEEKMIYYFSGTGNSKWIAKQISKQINDEVTDISSIMKEKRSTIVKADEKIGVIFPVYAWAPPEIVLNFLKTVRVEKGAYCYGICTCGDEPGYAMKKIEKYLPLNSKYSITMPNNYILGFDVDASEIAMKKIEFAKKRIAKISIDIINKKNNENVMTGKFAWIKSTIVSYAFNKFARSAKPFKVDEGCISCGLCEQICPTGNIRLVRGYPVWGSNCTQCLGCINRCPQKVIQYGTKTQNKGRYFIGMYIVKKK